MLYKLVTVEIYTAFFDLKSWARLNLSYNFFINNLKNGK